MFEDAIIPCAIAGIISISIGSILMIKRKIREAIERKNKARIKEAHPAELHLVGEQQYNIKTRQSRKQRHIHQVSLSHRGSKG